MSEETNGSSSPYLRLVVQGTGEQQSLGGEPVTIGSGAGNTILLRDPEVAESHATIRRADDEANYVVEDMGSPAGVYVNEQRVEGTLLLQEGDVIRAGSTLIVLLGEGERPPEVPLSLEEEGGVLPPAAPDPEEVIVVPPSPPPGPGEAGEVPPPPPPGYQEVGEEPPPAPKKGQTSPWLLAGIVAAVAILCLACVAFSAWGVLGGRGGDQVTSEPPIAVEVTTQLPASPSTPTPEATTGARLPTDTAVVPPPQVEYFQASPASISAGSCTSLQWGQVNAADEVTIEPGIGGVATPGRVEVCPEETTEFVLTATGPGGTTAARATVEVMPGPPDLVVETIVFDPDPATAGQPCEVEITVRNAGPTDAGSFDWQWRAGPDAGFDGRIDGLAAGETTVVVVPWVPGDGEESVSTEAVVDTASEVLENDEGNNRLTARVQVIPAPSQSVTLELGSESALDGFWLNSGDGSTSEDILVGNGEIVTTTGELVARGFMSFDLSDMAGMPTVESAEVRFFVSTITGDPYGKLRGLLVEHVNYGTSLDDVAYSAPAMDSAVLEPSASSSGWLTLSSDTLAAWVQKTLDAGQPRLQLRLRFSIETDGDGLEDWIAIQPGGSALASSRAPVLTVVYLP